VNLDETTRVCREPASPPAADEAGLTGFHTKMEMISRRAFGFRNFENYRLRVKVLCG